LKNESTKVVYTIYQGTTAKYVEIKIYVFMESVCIYVGFVEETVFVLAMVEK
jgi:hypothetical protein